MRTMPDKVIIIHGCSEIWNFSSRVQLDISLVRCAHSSDIELKTRREIPYLRAPIYYSLFKRTDYLQQTFTPEIRFWILMWLVYFGDTNLKGCTYTGKIHRHLHTELLFRFKKALMIKILLIMPCWLYWYYISHHSRSNLFLNSSQETENFGLILDIRRELEVSVENFKERNRLQRITG